MDDGKSGNANLWSLCSCIINTVRVAKGLPPTENKNPYKTEIRRKAAPVEYTGINKETDKI